VTYVAKSCPFADGSVQWRPWLSIWRHAWAVRYAVVASRGVWRSLVARFVRDEEVVGSNPATPTALKQVSSLIGADLLGLIDRQSAVSPQ
jgi:hypothetical protein